jgi:hypothetical protein
MSNLDLLLRYGSTGGRTVTSRSDFHIYLWPYDGNGTLQPANGAPGIAMLDYYSGLGMNFCRDHYQIAGGGQYSETNLRNGVDYWAATAEALRIDLWLIDTETSFYTGLAADAASDLVGAQNGTNWSKDQWATQHGTTMYVGNYGNSTGIRTQGIIGYPFAFSESTFRTLRIDNDTNGFYVGTTWDWMGPELYQTSIDSWIQGLDWLCNEKARMGTPAKLIPFIWRHAGAPTTYNLTRAQLEYAYVRPECNGVVLWGTENAAASPTYYDGAVWMQATLDFMAKYGITRGNPF